MCVNFRTACLSLSFFWSDLWPLNSSHDIWSSVWCVRGCAAGLLTWDMSGTFPRLEESVELAAGSWRQQQLAWRPLVSTQLPQQIFYKFRRRYSIEHNQHLQCQSPGFGNKKLLRKGKWSFKLLFWKSCLIQFLFWAGASFAMCEIYYHPNPFIHQGHGLKYILNYLHFQYLLSVFVSFCPLWSISFLFVSAMAVCVYLSTAPVQCCMNVCTCAKTYNIFQRTWGCQDSSQIDKAELAWWRGFDEKESSVWSFTSTEINCAH